MLSLEQQSYANLCLYRLNSQGVPWKTWSSQRHFNLCANTHGAHFYLADYASVRLDRDGYLRHNDDSFIRANMHYPVSLYRDGFNEGDVEHLHRMSFSIDMTEYFKESLRDALKSKINDRGKSF